MRDIGSWSLHLNHLSEKSFSSSPSNSFISIRIKKSNQEIVIKRVDKERLCEICNLKPARFRCDICGRFVCEDHYDATDGICVICKETVCRVCRKNLSIATCPVCGRLVCHHCLHDLGGLRVCFLCVINRSYVDFLRNYSKSKLKRIRDP